MKQHEELDRQVAELLERGLIEPSNSAWATSAVLVAKKDGTTRMAIDYRGLNEGSVPDEYPTPRIDDALDDMAESDVFTMLDMMWGYWQLGLRDEDRPKTAFRTRKGLWQ